MADLFTLRYVAGRYAHLQGLRLVPLGLVFLLMAMWRDGEWSRAESVWPARLGFVAVVLALVAGVAIHAWYGRRYGAVHPLRVGAGAAVLVAFTLIAIALIAVQDLVAWPFSLPLTFVGAALAYTGIAHHGLRRHYLWVAVPCLLFANAASFGIPLDTRQVMLDLLIGVGLLTGGIGDHLVLRQVLHLPSREISIDAPV